MPIALPLLELIRVDHVRDLVAELLASYEAEIRRIRTLIEIAYRSVQDTVARLSGAAKERDEIVARLKATLARNCSLRKTDFDSIMNRVVLLFENRRARLESQQSEVGVMLREYLSREQIRVSCIRERVENASDQDLWVTLRGVRDDMEREASHMTQVFLGLERRLRSHNKLQRDLNRKLRDLLEKGTFLRTEDVKRLQSSGSLLLGGLLENGGRDHCDWDEVQERAAPAAGYRAGTSQDEGLRHEERGF